MKYNTRVEKLIKSLTISLLQKEKRRKKGNDKGGINIKITIRPIINPPKNAEFESNIYHIIYISWLCK
jgi:hypothetical protein